MPEQYLRIKESLIKRGKSDKEAKRIAAATYNSRHPGHPMHGHKKKRGGMPRKDKNGYY